MGEFGDGLEVGLETSEFVKLGEVDCFAQTSEQCAELVGYWGGPFQVALHLLG